MAESWMTLKMSSKVSLQSKLSHNKPGLLLGNQKRTFFVDKHQRQGPKFTGLSVNNCQVVQCVGFPIIYGYEA